MVPCYLSKFRTWYFSREVSRARCEQLHCCSLLRWCCTSVQIGQKIEKLSRISAWKQVYILTTIGWKQIEVFPMHSKHYGNTNYFGLWVFGNHSNIFPDVSQSVGGIIGKKHSVLIGFFLVKIHYENPYSRGLTFSEFHLLRNPDTRFSMEIKATSSHFVGCFATLVPSKCQQANC